MRESRTRDEGIDCFDLNCDEMASNSSFSPAHSLFSVLESLIHLVSRVGIIIPELLEESPLFLASFNLRPSEQLLSLNLVPLFSCFHLLFLLPPPPSSSGDKEPFGETTS